MDCCLPLLRREIPVSHGTVTQVLPQQHVNAANDMPHHTISNDDDLLKTAQDFTNFFGGEPTHVTASRHVRSIITDTAARRHGRDH